MMGLSPYWRDALVNLICDTAASPGALPTLTAVVYTTLPDEAGAGGVQPAGGDGYAGAQPAQGSTVWGDSTGGNGESETLVDLDYGTPTVDWGPIVGAALIDSAGHLFTAAVEFDPPMSVTVGAPFTLPAATLLFAVT